MAFRVEGLWGYEVVKPDLDWPCRMGREHRVHDHRRVEWGPQGGAHSLDASPISFGRHHPCSGEQSYGRSLQM